MRHETSTRQRSLFIVGLLVCGTACDWLTQTREGRERRGSGSKTPATCPAVLSVTLSVTVSDAVTGKQLCDAEVSAVDERQLPLRFAPLTHGCSRLSYEGREARFNVTAQRLGYYPGSQQVDMKKRPCGHESPPVYLQLRPISTADNEAGSPAE